MTDEKNGSRLLQDLLSIQIDVYSMLSNLKAVIIIMHITWILGLAFRGHGNDLGQPMY